MTPKVIWNGLPIDTETLVSKHKSCVNDLGKLCEDNAKLTADNAKLKQRVEELEREVAHAEFIRKRFCAIVPDLTSQSWEDIWERVREMVRA